MESKYCFYLGTARGLLLRTTCTPNEKLTFEKSEQLTEICSLEFGRTEDELIVGSVNGNVCLYNAAENTFGKPLRGIEGSGAVTGVGCIDNSIVIARHDGIINLWNGKSRDFISLDLDEKGTLNCMALNKTRGNIVGTGGEFNDFKLWDVETKQCIFKAKSLGHDELNLPIPTSIRGICFFPSEERLSACATKEGHVLLYDDRTQRRPVGKFLEPKASYTTIACAFRERQCLVGTTRGYMQLLDMKTNKCLKTFTTFTGSVTSIACDPLEPFVATCSLDRHLRVHNIKTKELVYKAYMKQNLTKILMKPIVKNEPEDNVENNRSEVIDEEYEEIFNNMETVNEIIVAKQSKRKSVREKSGKVKRKKDE